MAYARESRDLGLIRRGLGKGMLSEIPKAILAVEKKILNDHKEQCCVHGDCGGYATGWILSCKWLRILLWGCFFCFNGFRQIGASLLTVGISLQVSSY